MEDINAKDENAKINTRNYTKHLHEKARKKHTKQSGKFPPNSLEKKKTQIFVKSEVKVQII